MISFDRVLFGLDKTVHYNCTYIHPERSSWYDQSLYSTHSISLFQDELLDILYDVGDVACVLGGDFNAKTGRECYYVDDNIIHGQYRDGPENRFCDFLLGNSDLLRFQYC